MHPFEVLADPVRRRILEHLGPGQMTAGAVSALITGEFGISQPAVSQHLRALRDSGLAAVRVDGSRRLYRVEPAALAAVAEWFGQFANPFAQPLDALGTELARGRRTAAAAAARSERARSEHARSENPPAPRRGVR